jgi:hypothetical protein
MVADLVALLDDNLTEMFQERAAVREHEGGYVRGHAEALAMLDVLNRYPEALSGVTVFAFEIDGATHFVVTTDRDLGREHVEKKGGAVRRADLAGVIRNQFDGVAALTNAA